MIQDIENLFSLVGVEDFNKTHFRRTPYASAETAKGWNQRVRWNLIREILESGYNDCWLARKGQLPAEPALNTGKLNAVQALAGIEQGKTLLIRHSERAHRSLKEIADGFEAIYRSPIDIQIYCTPPGEVGFDWHYDREEVFVIQCQEEKEFHLQANALNPIPKVFNPDLSRPFQTILSVQGLFPI